MSTLVSTDLIEALAKAVEESRSNPRLRAMQTLIHSATTSEPAFSAVTAPPQNVTTPASSHASQSQILGSPPLDTD